MPSHCPSCDGWMPPERRDEALYPHARCPGCPECEQVRQQLKQAAKTAGIEKTECVRLKTLGVRMCQALGISTDMDEEGLVKACEDMRAQRTASESEGTIMAAVHELAGVVEGHATSRINVLQRIRQLREIESSWSDMRARLAKAERLCNAVSRCEGNTGRFSCAALHDARCRREGEDGVASAPCTCGGDEYQEALAAWEQANG